MGRYQVLHRLPPQGPYETCIAGAAGAIGFEKRFRLHVLAPRNRAEEALVEALIEEARAAARLDHPNIASVLDLGRSEGRYFLASELVDAIDLRVLMRMAAGGDPVPLATVLHVVSAVAGALQHAHDRADIDGRPLDVLHSGVAPRAILLRRDGEVKLSDFAVTRARLRATGRATKEFDGLAYAAPELLAGRPVDARADVFSLGAVLYELVTGRRAFPGELTDVASKIIAGSYASVSELRPGTDPKLEAIVDLALATDPGARYVTADELRLDLLRLAATRGLQPSSVALRDTLVALDLDIASGALMPDDSAMETVQSTDDHPAVTASGQIAIRPRSLAALRENPSVWVATGVGALSAAATAAWWLTKT